MDEEVKAVFNKITGSSIFRGQLVDIRGEKTNAESLWLCPVNKREVLRMLERPHGVRGRLEEAVRVPVKQEKPRDLVCNM